MNTRLIVCAIFSMMVLSQPLQAGEYKHLGRYYLAKQNIKLEQRDPLQQYVQILFPTSVHTIESAYRYLLAPTGYTLADFNVIDKKFLSLSTKSLPVSQRAVNGKVIDLLNLLAGNEFVVVRDDLSREIAVDAKETNNE